MAERKYNLYFLTLLLYEKNGLDSSPRKVQWKPRKKWYWEEHTTASKEHKSLLGRLHTRHWKDEDITWVKFGGNFWEIKENKWEVRRQEKWKWYPGFQNVEEIRFCDSVPKQNFVMAFLSNNFSLWKIGNNSFWEPMWFSYIQLFHSETRLLEKW